MTKPNSPHSPPAAPDLRDLIYGDVPLAVWAYDAAFGHVRDALVTGDSSRARGHLHQILATPARASRDYLQAWHELRALGETPADPAYVHGVVFDVPVAQGRDTLAVYRDGTCRYINHRGGIVVWETRDAEVDALVGYVIDVGAAIAARIGPWKGPRPPLRPELLRLSMLCSGGLYFGEGPMSALSTDPTAGPLIAAGTRLLQAIVNRAES